MAGLGRVAMAPMDVRLSETDVLQPDVLVISKERRDRITPSVVDGAPDLVVEILSPSTAARDRGIEREAYERGGVAELWLVDAASRSAGRWSRAADGGRCSDGRFTEQIPSRAFPEVVVDLELLWSKLDF